MTIGQQSDDRIEQIDWASEVVRLGEGLDQTGRLDESRIERAIETLRQFSQRARDQGAATIVAVATEATRSAANGEAFLDRVRQETGIAVRVIGGVEEAALTFAGVAATTDLSGPVIIADIGGGSTELVMSRDGKQTAARSIPLGSGRLTDKFVRNDPVTPEELAACEAEAARAVESAIKAAGLGKGETPRLIVVGGTGEFMARLVPDEHEIDLAAVRSALEHMQSVTSAALASELSIPEARARVLPAGVAIVAALATRLKPKRIEISRSGIRAGLLREVFTGANEEQPDKAPEPDAQPADAKTTRKTGAQSTNGQRAGADYRETMARLIGDRWETVWRTIPVALAGEDIEGVHDVRVASRRLRAAMDIAAQAFPKSWYRPLHRAAKEITSALGEVRDRDVLLVALYKERDVAPAVERPGIDRLIERVERERVEARTEMERFLRDLLAGPIPREVEKRFGVPRPVVHVIEKDEEIP